MSNQLLCALVSLAVVSVVGCGNSNSPEAHQAASAEGQEQSPAQRFQASLEKARAGDAAAQKVVGDMYYGGEGVDKNIKEAISWFEKSAAQGNAQAMRTLGVIFFYGDSVVTAQPSVAIDYWGKADALGNADASVDLALAYASGSGVPKDPKKAAELMERGASRGDAVAQRLLAGFYFDGFGVPINAALGAEWMEKAASQGDQDAQTRTAVLYLEGIGVTKDFVAGERWARKAAEKGDALAQYLLGYLYSIGEGVPKDDIKAVQWWEKAAVQGNVEAMTNLGWAYSAGVGVQRDHVLAYAWTNLAASRGDTTAVKNRPRGALVLTKDELTEAQALSSNWKPGERISRSPGAGEKVTGILSKRGTGTAFIVSANGDAITNNHVVSECTEVRAAGREGIVRVTARDAVNDLALMQIPGKIDATAPISADPGKLRQGEDIVVFGFPLNSVLSSGGNLTPGVVSALTGIGNNTNQLQITAPIQPGSSGSPVLNKRGEVVGVVSMKLSDTKLVKATGSVGQNLNFAVSGQTLKTFLDSQKVKYTAGGLLRFEKSAADLADEGRKWTTLVECWR